MRGAYSKGCQPVCHLLDQGAPTASDRDVRHSVDTQGPGGTGGRTGLAAVGTGSTSITDDTNPSEADVSHALSPAEAGLLADLVRSARPADHPDRYAAVTIAERDALIAGVAREVARRNQARASSS